MSHLALGCMLMGTSTDPDSAHEMIERYLAAGGTFLDTADCYAWWPGPATTGGESETLLGEWFARTGRRDEVFLATKGSAWVADPVAVREGRSTAPEQYAGAGADTLRHALDGSLRRMGVDHVDLYYVHVDDLATPLEETLEALAGLVAAGKTRYLGWSNVQTWRLERIRALCDRHGWPAPVALQQENSYLRPHPGRDNLSVVDNEQLRYLRANRDLTLVSYSPILKGIYDEPGQGSANTMSWPRTAAPTATLESARCASSPPTSGSPPTSWCSPGCCTRTTRSAWCWSGRGRSSNMRSSRTPKTSSSTARRCGNSTRRGRSGYEAPATRRLLTTVISWISSSVKPAPSKWSAISARPSSTGGLNGWPRSEDSTE